MSKGLHLTVDPSRVSMAAAIRQAARAAPLLVVKAAALRDLVHELGGHEAAAEHLLTIAEEIGRPVGANLERGDGSQTVFVAPRSWSQERLQGWIGGHHEEIEDAFGPAVAMGPNRAERRRGQKEGRAQR